MRLPFPGMDPYLESSDNWRSFHHLLADEMMAQLNQLLGPRYYADVEVRTVLEKVGVVAAATVIYSDTAENIYQRGAYNRRIDYAQAVPWPALRPAMAAWVAEIMPYE